jgi:hypothetical protein
MQQHYLNTFFQTFQHQQQQQHHQQQQQQHQQQQQQQKIGKGVKRRRHPISNCSFEKKMF